MVKMTIVMVELTRCLVNGVMTARAELWEMGRVLRGLNCARPESGLPALIKFCPRKNHVMPSMMTAMVQWMSVYSSIVMKMQCRALDSVDLRHGSALMARLGNVHRP